MASKGEVAPKTKGSPGADRTPVSSSGVVTRRPGESRLDAARTHRHRAGDSEPPSLTPYQARLDVEMDDTAISKVRDPSVSISLDADSLLPIPAPRTPLPERATKFQPVVSIALGTLLGALIVAVLALVVRALSH